TSRRWTVATSRRRCGSAARRAEPARGSALAIITAPRPTETSPFHRQWWRVAIPLGVVVMIALIPSPLGLAPHAWYYFAIFSGVIAALVLEPLPNPAVGVIGVTTVALLAPWTLFGPADMAKPGFNA